MKTKYFLTPAIAMAFAAACFIISCKEKEPVGKCSDPILSQKFRTNGLVLNAPAQDTTIKTDNAFWWDATMILDAPEIINPSSESPDIIEYDWITVERTDYSNRLRISAEENTTGEQREVKISLSIGNCFATFPVIQKAAEEE